MRDWPVFICNTAHHQMRSKQPISSWTNATDRHSSAALFRAVLLDGIWSLQPVSLWYCWWPQWITRCYPQSVIQAKIYTLFTHYFSEGTLNNLFIWCSFPNFILNNITVFCVQEMISTILARSEKMHGTRTETNPEKYLLSLSPWYF